MSGSNLIERIWCGWEYVWTKYEKNKKYQKEIKLMRYRRKKYKAKQKKTM